MTIHYRCSTPGCTRNNRNFVEPTGDPRFYIPRTRSYEEEMIDRGWWFSPDGEISLCEDCVRVRDEWWYAFFIGGSRGSSL